MKVFIKVEAFFEGTTRSATKSFAFDINKEEESLTVAEVKLAVRDQFKRIELSDRLVSEKVEFIGRDDHEDTVDLIALGGKFPEIKYVMTVSEPEAKPRSMGSIASSGVPQRLQVSNKINKKSQKD
jgi:hypothetical protein